MNRKEVSCYILSVRDLSVLIFSGNSIFRGNRYRFKENYGEMLLFDSNGQIAGMQIGVNLLDIHIKIRNLK